jgi:dihydroxyacetone kinase-like predicted kinase
MTVRKALIPAAGFGTRFLPVTKAHPKEMLNVIDKPLIHYCVEEILGAIENLPTDRVIVLPNNKNILMSARQAIELTVKQVAVVPSKSVPQGIAAMLALCPPTAISTQRCGAMTEAMSGVVTGEVTVATRSVDIDGVHVQEGQAIGLLDGKLAAAGDSPEAVTMKLLEKGTPKNAELITLYYGADMPVMQANQLADRIRGIRSDLLSVRDDLNTEIAQATQRADELAKTIANLNTQITTAEAGGAGPASALRDQRDQALSKLSELFSIVA